MEIKFNFSKSDFYEFCPKNQSIKHIPILCWSRYLLHKTQFFILFVEIEQILMAIYSRKVNAVALPCSLDFISHHISFFRGLRGRQPLTSYAVKTAKLRFCSAWPPCLLLFKPPFSGGYRFILYFRYFPEQLPIPSGKSLRKYYSIISTEDFSFLTLKILLFIKM